LDVPRVTPQSLIMLKRQPLCLQEALKLRVSVGHRERIHETAFGCSPISDRNVVGRTTPGGSGKMNGPAWLCLGDAMRGLDRSLGHWGAARAAIAAIRPETPLTKL
jgi:hypothetical protein